MNVKLAVASLALFSGANLLLGGNTVAQTSGIFKVSGAIEGSNNPAGVSVARCGPGIVVGFGDQEPGTTSSNAGVAISRNGSSFTDMGTLADPSLSFGGGESSVIGCSNQSTFYYTTLGFFEDTSGSTQCVVGCTEIMVSPSTNGGTSWGPAVVASAGTVDNHQFSSPSFAVDPSNPLRLYAAYLDAMTNPNDFPDCGGQPNSIILEFVFSADGGKSWSGRANPAQTGNPNMELDHSCSGAGGGSDPARNGSLASPSVVVGPTGVVYVAYSFTGQDPNTAAFTGNQIRVIRSTNHGSSFGAPVAVSSTAVNFAAPTLGVDRTSSTRRGEVYVTWSGARSSTSTDVLVADSVNNGASFSFPRPISPAPLSGSGHFQTSPVVAVDFDGQVAACYYETPGNSPTSSSVYSFNCATSFNHSASWTTRLVKSAVPVGFGAVTSDFLLHNDGFLTMFEVQVNGTRSVVGQKFEMN